MAWSDKKIIAEARKKYDRLEKVGIESDALDILKNNLEVFYSTNKGVRKTSISGISLKKSMTTQQRKEMRQILRSFIRSDGSSANSIQRKYEKLLGRYQAETIKPRKPPKIKSIKQMSKEVRRLERLLEDRKTVSYLGSQVVRDVWEEQKEQGYSVEVVRNVMSDFVEEIERLESSGIDYALTNDEISQKILERIEEVINHDAIV